MRLASTPGSVASPHKRQRHPWAIPSPNTSPIHIGTIKPLQRKQCIRISLEPSSLCPRRRLPHRQTPFESPELQHEPIADKRSREKERVLSKLLTFSSILVEQQHPPAPHARSSHDRTLIIFVAAREQPCGNAVCVLEPLYFIPTKAGLRGSGLDRATCDIYGYDQGNDDQNIPAQVEEISIEYLIRHLFHVGNLSTGRKYASR